MIDETEIEPVISQTISLFPNQNANLSHKSVTDKRDKGSQPAEEEQGW
jgi:hypothetical protein